MADTNALVVVSPDRSGSQIVPTPEGHPNYVMTFITPIAAILINTSIAFLTALLSLLGAAGLGAFPPFGDFAHALRACALGAMSVAVLTALRGVLTLLTEWGKKFPLPQM